MSEDSSRHRLGIYASQDEFLDDPEMCPKCRQTEPTYTVDTRLRGTDKNLLPRRCGKCLLQWNVVVEPERNPDLCPSKDFGDFLAAGNHIDDYYALDSGECIFELPWSCGECDESHFVGHNATKYQDIAPRQSS